MYCKNCLYIRDELQERLAAYNIFTEYNNSTENIYDYISYQVKKEKCYQDCYCPKLDACLLEWEERCDTIYLGTLQSKTHKKKSKKRSKKTRIYRKHTNVHSKNMRIHSKKKRGYKRRQYMRYQRHLKQLWRIARYPYPVLYVDEICINGKYCDRKVPYYRKESENHGGIGRRFCKKMSNKRIRHYKGEISKGGNYRKIYDYQWMIC